MIVLEQIDSSSKSKETVRMNSSQSIVALDEVNKESRPLDILYNPLSILIVNDEPMNLLILNHLMQSLGTKTETANNGEGAVNKACNIWFDIIIMDLEMPIMNGFVATSRIKE